VIGRSRRNLPVLAELSGPAPEASRAWSLRRADLKALEGLLRELSGAAAVLVTGAEDGRSAVAVGLATAATAAGMRTALLECDIAEPSVAAALGLKAEPGLHEYLRGDAEAAEILQPLVLAGPASGRAGSPLVCVVGGAASADGDDLFAADGFRHAAEKLRHAYELVVVAGPALDRGGRQLVEAAAIVDVTLAAVPRSALSGRRAKAVGVAMRRLPAPPAGLVAFGEPE
jgi:Mrp family chromosome partitioning ATPase